MSVVQDLLKLFRVDKQLRGLRSRLDNAERFLEQQRSLLKELDDKRGALEGQVRQLKAGIANDEGEAKRIEQKIATVREQMNAVKTAKEYNAGLAELNNFKESKTKFEESALEAMTKLDGLESQFADLRKLHEERSRMVAGAESDRAAREAEIRDRLTELTAQRAALAAGVPAEALKTLESLIRTKGDEAMAAVEVLDRRNHEYSCTACMMTLPVETVSAMLAGKLTRCVSCSCIIYTEEDLLEKPAKEKPAKQKASKKQVAQT
jgi:predicted  nucleic acid-binding Zn-ribbon protein